MEINNEIFYLDHETGRLKVETINLPGQVLFRVNFPDSNPPVIICRATDINQSKFWTSIPEGRQKFALEIGPLIEIYFRAKMK